MKEILIVTLTLFAMTCNCQEGLFKAKLKNGCVKVKDDCVPIELLLTVDISEEIKKNENISFIFVKLIKKEGSHNVFLLELVHAGGGELNSYFEKLLTKATIYLIYDEERLKQGLEKFDRDNVFGFTIE